MTNDGRGNFSLSIRERQVLQLVCDGLKYRQVATALGMSENTVHRYVNSFFRAFNVADRQELASWVSQQPELISQGRARLKAA